MSAAFLRRPLVREALIAAAAAAMLASLLVWLGPPGIDFAAHSYQRTFLLQHGFALWNNFWYSGRYSFVTYSFVYYPLAAVLGIKVLAVLSIAFAAIGFTLVVWWEWGAQARLSSRAFTLLWPGIIVTGAFPFGLGIGFGLIALAALQRGHRRSFALLVFLTLLASPLSFLLVLLVLAGGALGARPARATVVVLAGAVGFELVVRRLFPGQGRFPFTFTDLLPGAVFGALGLLVTARVPGARRLFGLFAFFSAALLVAFIIPSDLGSNVERLKFAAIPLALLAAALAPRRIVFVVPLVAFACFWNIAALARTAQAAGSDPTSDVRYWQPAISYLKNHLSPSYRVEAVDTREHWPAAYLPDAGIPIVRGWYRQNDFPQNELLYDKSLGAKHYQAWLRDMGVRYVVLTDGPPDYSSRAEAVLLASGDSGLTPVFSSAHVTIYELPDPRAIVTGPGKASVMWMYPTRIVFTVTKPGLYRVKVRWSPYWRTAQGCVFRGPDGTIRVQARRVGLVEVRMKVSVSRGLETLAGFSSNHSCG